MLNFNTNDYKSIKITKLFKYYYNSYIISYIKYMSILFPQKGIFYMY